MRRCPIASGPVALCLSARARNWTASSRITSPLNPTMLAGPQAVEDEQQQQRIFGGLSECFSLFDQQTCPSQQQPWFPAPRNP